MKAQIAIALCSAVGLMAAADVPILGDFSAILQGGALTVLAWVAWMQFGEMRDNRKERMETIAKLTEALTNLREHCATRRDDIKP